RMRCHGPHRPAEAGTVSARLAGVTDGRKSFGSDNHAGAHPAVLAALTAANSGDAVAYGADQWTAAATAALCSAFGARGAYLVFTGSAANVLSLSLMVRPFEAIICADCSHLNTDECGAAERMLGSKLLLAPAPDGKLTVDRIAARLAGRGDEHRVQPRAVALTQSTELGTCYTLAELREISEFCRASGLRLFLDGARLANAAAYLGCKLADLAACADALSFGGTKNGAVGAEAVLLMCDDLLAAMPFQRKQQLQLASKMRYLAAQFSALLAGDLWRQNAQHANAMARRLADGLAAVPGVALAYPVQANAVFVTLDPEQIRRLQQDWSFELWDPERNLVRWMTAFDTTAADVDELVAAVRVS
ncbi:MAG: threonine aldolase family protein, partial [Streptosporangiaceae bacterium]